MSFTVALGELPRTDTEKREAAVAASRFGIADVDEKGGVGLEIKEVRVPSAAATAGLRPTQIITAVAGRKVETLSEFFDALANAGLHQGRQVKLTIRAAAGQGEREVVVSPR